MEDIYGTILIVSAIACMAAIFGGGICAMFGEMVDAKFFGYKAAPASDLLDSIGGCWGAWIGMAAGFIGTFVIAYC